jgi:hypothetical protein
VPGLCGVGHRKGWVVAEYDANLFALGGDPLTEPAPSFDVAAVALVAG